MRDVSIDQIVRECDNVFMSQDADGDIVCLMYRRGSAFPGIGKNALAACKQAYVLMKAWEKERGTISTPRAGRR